MFGKKTTAEELIKLYSALSNEEKQKFLGAVNGDGEEKPTEEPAPDNEPTADADALTEEDKGNEDGNEEPPTPPAEETEGAGETPPDPTEEAAPTEDAPTEETPAEDAPPMPDNQAADNTAEVLEKFGARLSAIEESLKEFAELKELMRQYTQAQADKFGYNGTVPDGKKDYQEMSADEMKAKILNGEI